MAPGARAFCLPRESSPSRFPLPPLFARKVSGDRGPEEVLIRSRGDVFVYLRDLGAEGERRDGAYVCADRPSKITEDARSFTGAVTLAGKRPRGCSSRGACHAVDGSTRLYRSLASRPVRYALKLCKFSNNKSDGSGARFLDRFLCNGSETHVFRVMQGQDCAETLAKLSAQSWDGRDFLLDDDYEPWCREFQQEGECILELLGGGREGGEEEGARTAGFRRGGERFRTAGRARRGGVRPSRAPSPPGPGRASSPPHHRSGWRRPP